MLGCCGPPPSVGLITMLGRAETQWCGYTPPRFQSTVRRRFLRMEYEFTGDGHHFRRVDEDFRPRFRCTPRPGLMENINGTLLDLGSPNIHRWFKAEDDSTYENFWNLVSDGNEIPRGTEKWTGTSEYTPGGLEADLRALLDAIDLASVQWPPETQLPVFSYVRGAHYDDTGALIVAQNSPAGTVQRDDACPNTTLSPFGLRVGGIAVNPESAKATKTRIRFILANAQGVYSYSPGAWCVKTASWTEDITVPDPGGCVVTCEDGVSEELAFDAGPLNNLKTLAVNCLECPNLAP
jgi:hypothetical protein